MKNIIFLLSLIALYSCSTKEIEIELPSIIADGMVLQQKSEVAIWGWSAPEAKIKIQASWGESVKTKVASDGKWTVKLKTPTYGGPFTIEIKSGGTNRVLTNVMVGEVWLCSGQSNMEMPLKGWPPNDLINNYKQEIATANFPNIRMFTVAKNNSAKPLSKCSGSWDVCSPETVGDFSATAYFYGKKLHQELGVPIGLIHSSWGGTPAEAWTPSEEIANVPGYESFTDDLEETQKSYAAYLSFLDQLENFELESLDKENPYENLDLNDSLFIDANLDVTNWKSIDVPSLWETEALPGFDGMVWLIKDFQYDASIYPEGIKLDLGAVDDMDATFINGVEVGRTETDGNHASPRLYQIPVGVLKKGKNRLAVKVTDNRGGGGIYEKHPQIVKGDKVIADLGGMWKYLPVATIKGKTVYVFGEDEKSFENAPIMKVAFTEHTPTSLYNGMIEPLLPYTLQGAIWYQGESNVGRGEQYEVLFPAMIESWRKKWDSDFSFYFVQIAPYDYGVDADEKTAALRDAQLKTLDLQRTGMAVTMDVGNPKNIHPGNKQDVGERLALWALANDYQKDIVYSGPIFNSIEVKDEAIFVGFEHAKGLNFSSDESFFELAGENGVFYKAQVQIEGETLIVSSNLVKSPKHVRYAWCDDCEPNLFNGSNLPASPFKSK